MTVSLPRRAALLGAASLLGAAAAPDPKAPPAAPAPPPVRPGFPAPPNSPGLNERAMRNGRFFGAAIDDRILADDAPYMNQVVRECGIVVSETAFKWGALRPKINSYDFAPADRLARFAERHAIMLRGHALLWHEDNPAWLTESITPANAEKLLKDHIHTVAGHFRNRVVHWDVVNEVLQLKDGKPFGLRDSLWTRALGPDCIDIAFRACAEADPAALRCINDFGLDYEWAEEEAKRQAMLTLLARLKSRGVPIQALGMQAHLQAGVKEFNQSKLAQFCADVAAMGLKIVITEFDVRDNRVGGDPALRDAAVASQGRAYLDAVLTCPAVLGVLSWGLSDRRSWLNDDLPRDDKLAQRALPLDSDLRRKPLWQALADAFAAAPPRA
jgi:endo-1,4-beta-xylanase